MENKMNKFGLRKMLAVLAVAFACVCMWGCGDTTFEWEEKRSGAKVMGFVNDSLVMVEDYRCWHEYTDRWNGEYLEDDGCENARLCVYNYRVQEDGPRWCDSISGSWTLGLWDGQFSDSVIWGHLNVQRENSISLWKIGEKPHTINLNRNLEGCSIVFRGNSVKEWIDGTFIVRNEKSLNAGGDSCQYAVLDTSLKTITYKRLEKNLEWIENCDDVRAWEKDVYCVILDDEGENSHVLKNKNDTIPTPRKFAIGGFWGNMIKMSGNICNINNDKITCSDVIWYGNGEGLKFYQNDEIVVEY